MFRTCALPLLIAVPFLLCAAAPAAPPAIQPEVEETVAGTERLLVMMDSPDPVRQVAVARLLAERLPPTQFEGRGAVFPAYDAPARHELSRKAWRDDLARAVRALGRALLGRESMEDAAVGATLLVLVGQADDLRALTEAMTRFVDRTADAAGAPAYMPGMFDPFLAASQAAVYRGAEPAAGPRTTGEIVVYLNKLSTHRDWNPPGWRARMSEWRRHPSTFVRLIASSPYPLGRDLKKTE